jgi:hypothetical protein
MIAPELGGWQTKIGDIPASWRFLGSISPGNCVFFEKLGSRGFGFGEILCMRGLSIQVAR